MDAVRMHESPCMSSVRGERKDTSKCHAWTIAKRLSLLHSFLSLYLPRADTESTAEVPLALVFS